MAAYYNEIDPQAAAWLRELINRGLIADGEVDERSIEDVHPDDLRQFTQCHFFAGVGVWSYALRLACWPDDRPVWTGSCPCQPFSTAGKGKAFTDERHLWPAFHWLICQSRPDIVFGEQVASKDGTAWLDLVSSDMEGESYAIGAATTVACGFGAPHKRPRLYWVAYNNCQLRSPTNQADSFRRPKKLGRSGLVEFMGDNQNGGLKGRRGFCHNGSTEQRGDVAANNGNALSLVNPQHNEHQRGPQGPVPDPEEKRSGTPTELTGHCTTRGVAHNNCQGFQKQHGERREPEGFTTSNGTCWPGPTNGFWRDVDWLGCRDGKWRPVEPGTFPLAHGAPARVGRLRGYGNAIVAQQAAAFIEAYREVTP